MISLLDPIFRPKEGPFHHRLHAEEMIVDHIILGLLIRPETETETVDMTRVMTVEETIFAEGETMKTENTIVETGTETEIEIEG